MTQTDQNQNTIDDNSANGLIAADTNLVHIRKLKGQYFAAYTRYDREFTDRCHYIPSWTWDKARRHFIVHYLDLPLLETVAFNAGYEVKYALEVPQYLMALREMYLKRRKLKQDGPTLDVPAKRPLRKYQVLGAEFMYRCKKVINADGMGAGKTSQAIGAIILNKINDKPYRTLVVCPASVKMAWKREIEEVSDLKVVILDRSMNKRMEQYVNGLSEFEVAIITYDGFLADYDELAKEFTPNILVVDECHRLCNRTNRITQLLIGGKNIKKTFISMVNPHSIYLLTGTPISNRLDDLYAIMRTLDPGIFKGWTGFTNRYTVEEQFGRWTRQGGKPTRTYFNKIVGYKNEKELKAKLSLFMIRRTKDEVLPELPPKVFETIEVELGTEERKAYKELRRDYKTFLRGKEIKITDQLQWLTRAQQIANSLELLPDSKAKKSSKLEELVRICNEQAPARKIVVFSKFAKMTKIICRELKHLKPLHLHGSVKAEDRQDMIDKFQNNEENRVFVATLGAGGVGITLTAADLCIFYDKWWSPSLNTQAADRLHRIGQKNSVLVVTLRCKDTIDEYIEKTWLEKQELVQNIVGDEKILGKLTRDELGKLV